MKGLWRRWLNRPLLERILEGVAVVLISGWVASETVRGIVAGIARWFWCLFVARYSIPGWVIALVLLVGGSAILFVVRTIVTQGKRDEKPEWYGYTEDRIFGVPWTWSWSLDGRVAYVCAFCPVCADELVAEGSSIVHQPVIRLACQNCSSGHAGNKVVTEIDVGTYTLEYRVGKEIRRRVRTGEWRRVVAQKPAR